MNELVRAEERRARVEHRGEIAKTAMAFILVPVCLGLLGQLWPSKRAPASVNDAGPTLKAFHQTAEEFRQQSECGELREKCDRQYRREHPSEDSITVTSQYSTASNRCLVRVRSVVGYISVDDNLYDAQTMQILAWAHMMGIPHGDTAYTAGIGQGSGTGYAALSTTTGFIDTAMRQPK